VVTDRSANQAGAEAFEIDTTAAHAARIYNYLLGGDDNFAADREAAEQLFADVPGGVDTMRTLARAGEAFLARAVGHLAGEVGVRQFLNVGTMIPFGDNVHDIAQRVAPDAHVVYVVRDPLVLAHVHRLRPSTPEGSTAIVHDALRALPALMGHVAEALDLSQPLAVVLHGTLHFVSPPRDPYEVVRQLMEPTGAGSHLLISHYASDLAGGALVTAAERQGALAKGMRWPFVPRSQAEVTQFFDGLELVAPGVVPAELWRPTDPRPRPADEALIPGYGAVGRKP
jgi:hypothetical protein